MLSEIVLFLESFAKTKMRFRASKHSKNQLQIEEKKGASVSTDFWSSDSVNFCKEQALCCIWIMALDRQSLVSCRAKCGVKIEFLNVQVRWTIAC